MHAHHFKMGPDSQPFKRALVVRVDVLRSAQLKAVDAAVLHREFVWDRKAEVSAPVVAWSDARHYQINVSRHNWGAESVSFLRTWKVTFRRVAHAG